MDVKNNSNGGGPKMPRIGDISTGNVWFVLGAIALGAAIYQSGYHTGCNTANKILRRHDKDEKRLKKDFKTRMKEFKKEWVP